MEWRTFAVAVLVAIALDTSCAQSDYEGIVDVDHFIGREHSARLKTTPSIHKPVFTNCTKYATSIEEQQPKGLHVIRVVAEDKDPPDQGGRITYSLVQRDGDREFFRIDNVTGDITTNYEFDRDQPSNMKEMYITVQATDNGRPRLTDICIFKVTITDINDNAPLFDHNSIEFNEKVSEDLRIGSEVMRVVAYDFDDSDNAKLKYSIQSEGTSNSNDFDNYFKIEPDSGIVRLHNSLTHQVGVVFTSSVSVQDSPLDPSTSKMIAAPISITVVSSDKRPPSFVNVQAKSSIKENYNEFNAPIVSMEAISNIDDPNVIFQLIRGLTIQTNKENTFVLEQVKTKAYIKVARQLDYEIVTDYQLTVKCTNRDEWSVIRTIDIHIEDVNDEIPTFMEFVTGSVLENEDANAEVMQVRAIDKDGTSDNNIVTYELEDHTSKFAIHPTTGKVTTKVPFDREEQDVYTVKIKAKDNSQSALTGQPYNSASQTFRITIEDMNDNPPRFLQPSYHAENIPEDAGSGKDVIEVKATDKDTASLIHYRIIEGNIDDAFSIMSTTGRITVNKGLDFEKIEEYTLKVEANDGIYNDTTMVYIKILNVNDNLPVFKDYEKNITLREEYIPPGCIITLEAYDPDIKDRNADQKIVYKVKKSDTESQSDNFAVDSNGCVTQIKTLDCDRPNGSPIAQVFIFAYDDGYSPSSKSERAELQFTVKDINDNAPFLNVTEVVWYENREPGNITFLSADDYDCTPANRGPFSYRIASDVGEEIKSMFSIEGDVLRANVKFDREEKKFHNIRIEITDSGSPPLTGVGTLRVIIGDENDNFAKDGESTIFVYDFMGQSPDMLIGRVYVDDEDDWDLNDKRFSWKEQNSKFELDKDTGELTLRQGTPEGVYTLYFSVVENHLPLIEDNRVEAKVTVTVKILPEDAVYKSGSIRMSGCTAEEFIDTKISGINKKEILQRHLSSLLNTSFENVDIVTVIAVPEMSDTVDVRFSAHGSPYYEAEKLNYRVANSSIDLERKLDVHFLMIDINECYEDTCEKYCYNNLNISGPAVIFTNKTSFVGVNAVIEPICQPRPLSNLCYNGGVPIEDAGCSCPEGFDGPHCELLGVGFAGNGWALYKPFDSTIETVIYLELTTQQENGLIFYEGPLFGYPTPLTLDFISLELYQGYPRLLLNYGNDTAEVILRHKKLNDDNNHSIRINLQPKEISLSVDDCHQSNCQKLADPKGEGAFLNTNGPLQVGGIVGNIKEIATRMNWAHVPTYYGFSGCVRNLTYNGVVYNLGQPGESKNISPNCNYFIAKAVSFRIDSNFLVAILVCIAILIILLLAVVVHRRKHDNWGEKDTDDIRETIISYEDEGGGEGDTGFDLSVLRQLQNNDYPIKDKTPEVADMSGFLAKKKDLCDKEANCYPYDDVRHYAYEGGGDSNSAGSLSSLASCTDDGDLKFNYLSSFGPRFRKLADMYGEEPSDEDSQDGGEESWC